MRVRNEDEEGQIKNISYNIVHDVSVRCICIYIYEYLHGLNSRRGEERRGEEGRGEERGEERRGRCFGRGRGIWV